MFPPANSKLTTEEDLGVLAQTDGRRFNNQLTSKTKNVQHQNKITETLHMLRGNTSPR